MAAHEVELGIASPVPIGNVDIALKVKKDGLLLGTLNISRGGADYVPSGARTRYELSWTQLHDLLMTRGTAKPKR